MKQQGSRWLALDVLRGAAVAGMIVVTSPGDWSRTYAPLRHADWNGWTLADMIFPTFLFAVGMALALSFPRAAGDGAWGRVARRALALIALGLALSTLDELKNGFWFHDPGAGTLAHVRIPGILQRIALCYVLAAGLILATARSDAERRAVNGRAVGAAIAVLLLVYWVLLSFVPVPGYGAGQLDPAGSLTAWIDRMVFTTPHMWRYGAASFGGVVTYDPEGLLSTLPATANLLFGVLAARAWQLDPDRAPARIAIAGVVLFAAGLLLDPWFAINKKLWTSSFALLSSGFSALVLAVAIVALRSDAAQRLAAPLRILGGNAILAFTLSILLGVFAGLPFGNAGVTPQVWGNRIALGIIPDPYLASYACALAILALITLILWPLHRRGLHLRL
jgi:predicted acyltransferase